MDQHHRLAAADVDVSNLDAARLEERVPAGAWARAAGANSSGRREQQRTVRRSIMARIIRLPRRRSSWPVALPPPSPPRSFPLLAQIATPAASAGTSCANLAALTIPNVTIRSATLVPAGPFTPPGAQVASTGSRARRRR